MSRKLQNTDLSSGLLDSMGIEVINIFEKCDVDVDDLYSKAIVAIMGNGSALLDESAHRKVFVQHNIVFSSSRVFTI